MKSKTIVMAGIPAVNKSLFQAISFNVGDPTALIRFMKPEGEHRLLILRDIEMARARSKAAADVVACPAEYLSLIHI